MCVEGIVDILIILNKPDILVIAAVSTKRAQESC